MQLVPLQRRKEQQRKCVMNWPQLLFPTPCTPGGGGREFGNQVEPGKNREMEEGVFLRFSLYFSLPCSDVIGNKLN